MPDPLAVHFTTSPTHVAGLCDVTATITLACAPDLGLVTAGDWSHTGQPSDATCDACIASPEWVEAARATITDLADPELKMHMRPLAGRHRRTGAVVISARGRSQLEGRRIRVLEELAVAAWSLAIAPPRTAPSFPATPGDDGTADRVLDELRLRQFVADEVAAIIRARPDLARYLPPIAAVSVVTDEAYDLARIVASGRDPRLDITPAAGRSPFTKETAAYFGTLSGDIPGTGRAYDDPYGWPADDPALD